MSNEERVQVLLFLTQNIDVFAWNPYEVPGVDPGFIVHKLNALVSPEEAEIEKISQRPR